MKQENLTDEDAASIGRAFMEKLPEGYCWNECPTEYVDDLHNQQEVERVIGQVDRRDAARYRWVRVTGGPVVDCAGLALDEAVDSGIDANLRKIPGAIDPRTGKPFIGPSGGADDVKITRALWTRRFCPHCLTGYTCGTGHPKSPHE